MLLGLKELLGLKVVQEQPVTKVLLVLLGHRGLLELRVLLVLRVLRVLLGHRELLV